MTCTCSRLAVGMTLTDVRNWNPDCEEHGMKSAHYGSPEQVLKREAMSERTIDLQRQAREARRKAKEETA